MGNWCIYASDKWTTNMRSCWSRSGKAWEGGKEVSWVVQGLLNNRWLVIPGPFLSQVLSSLCHVRLRYSQGAVRQGQHQLMPNICHRFLQLKIFQGFIITGEKICNCVFFFSMLDNLLYDNFTVTSVGQTRRTLQNIVQSVQTYSKKGRPRDPYILLLWLSIFIKFDANDSGASCST